MARALGYGAVCASFHVPPDIRGHVGQPEAFFKQQEGFIDPRVTSANRCVSGVNEWSAPCPGNILMSRWVTRQGIRSRIGWRKGLSGPGNRGDDDLFRENGFGFFEILFGGVRPGQGVSLYVFQPRAI